MGRDKQRPNQEDRSQLWEQQIRLHRCESCPGTATLKEFLDRELNEHEDDEKFNYCQWDTTDRATLTNFTATYKEYTRPQEKEGWGRQPTPPPPHHFLEQNLFFHVKLENIKFLNVKNGLAFIYWTIHNWQKVDSFFWICCFSSIVSYHSYQKPTTIS